MLQEHVCTAECGEGGAVARVPDRPRAHVQQVQEEDRQEVPGGRTVRHVHLQQVSTVLYVSQMKLSWKLLKICKEISLNGQSTYVDTASTLISPHVLPVFLLLAGPLRKCPPVPSSIIRPYHSAASHPTLLHHHTLPFCIITPYTLLHHHTLPSCIITPYTLLHHHTLPSCITTLTVLLCCREMAMVRYIGHTDFAPGIWIGLELKNPKGKSHSHLLTYIQ